MKRFKIHIALLICALMQFFFIDAAISQNQQEMEITGNYKGSVFLENGAKKVDVRLTVTALKGNEYEAVLYFVGSPREKEKSTAEQKKVELQGSYTDFTLRLTGDFPLVFQFIHNRFTALDEENSYQGHLEKVISITGSSSN